VICLDGAIHNCIQTLLLVAAAASGWLACVLWTIGKSEESIVSYLSCSAVCVRSSCDTIILKI
jgi:hypothetical protein